MIEFAHIAIGVPAASLSATINWYAELFAPSERLWSIGRDELSAITIGKSIEAIFALKIGAVEIHFLSVDTADKHLTSSEQFLGIQHFCVTVDESLELYVDRWQSLCAPLGGDYESPEIRLDNPGYRTIYMLDPNGIEIELREFLAL